MLIMWGCLLAVAITLPLVFGWLNKRSPIRPRRAGFNFLSE